VLDIWPGVEPWLERAMVYHPFMDISDLLVLVLEQRVDLLAALSGGALVGAVVMEVMAYPRRRVGNILALAGRLGFYRHHLDATMIGMRAWCTERGCDTITFAGRTGWSRYIVRNGWQSLPLLTGWQALDGIPAQQS